MKKIKLFFLIMVASFYLSACTYTSKTEEVFSISNEDVMILNNAVRDRLVGSYWKYIEQDNEFYEGIVETKDSKNYEQIYTASMDTDLDISKYSGREIRVVSTKIMHFNNTVAGVAYFYFYDKMLIGEYYIDVKGSINSLNNINTFLKDVNFSNYEDLSKIGEFSQKSIKLPFDKIDDINLKGEIAVIDDDDNYKLKVFELKKNNSEFYLSKSVYLDGLQVIDFKYTKHGAIALLGTFSVIGELTENEISENSLNNTSTFDSKKIVLLDENYKKTREITLDIIDYTSVLFNEEENIIFVSVGNSIDIFQLGENQDLFTKTSQITLNHWVDKIKRVDLDNNGSFEIIASDGMDIYVYVFLDDNLQLVWRTNLSIKTLNNVIYTGDLNRDGVDEIYVEDLFKTTIKYILTESGINGKSDKTQFGIKNIVGDFNSDGIYDYIEVNNEENISNIYIGK